MRYEITVSWSYPTSPNAEWFGHADGCWTVDRRLVGGVKPGLAMCAFDVLADAVAHATELDALGVGTYKADPRHKAVSHA